MVYYLAGDHLGTTSVVLNENGTVHSQARHYPYGEVRWFDGTLPTDYRFTGQRDVGLGGLYHMGARFYDSSLARWISADTIVPEPENPQAFNRYSWVQGNPLRFIDPTGHARYGGDDYDPAEDFTGSDLLPLGLVLSMEPQRAVDYIVNYVEEEFSLFPADGVTAKFEEVNPSSGLEIARNYNEGNKDDLIEIFPDAFENAGNTADLVGTVHKEIYHSQQEAEIEEYNGQGIWSQPAPCTGACPEEWYQYESTRFWPGAEIEALEATRALPLQYSPEYKQGIEKLIEDYTNMRSENYLYYYPPGTRLAPMHLPTILKE